MSSEIGRTECNKIELEILGCHLENLTAKQCEDVLDGNLTPKAWRGGKCRTRNGYCDHVRSVFERTKDRFDWEAAVYKVADGGGVRPTKPWPDPPTKKYIDSIREQAKFPILQTIPEDWSGDPVDLRFLSFALKVNKIIIHDKSPEYKDSWRKRGLVGIYHNLCRKWDRIENVFEDERLSGGRELNVDLLSEGDESIVETVADLFAYTGKCMAYFGYKEEYRPMLRAWEKKHGIEHVE